MSANATRLTRLEHLAEARQAAELRAMSDEALTEEARGILGASAAHLSAAEVFAAARRRLRRP